MKKTTVITVMSLLSLAAFSIQAKPALTIQKVKPGLKSSTLQKPTKFGGMETFVSANGQLAEFVVKNTSDKTVKNVTVKGIKATSSTCKDLKPGASCSFKATPTGLSNSMPQVVSVSATNTEATQVGLRVGNTTIPHFLGSIAAPKPGTYTITYKNPLFHQVNIISYTETGGHGYVVLPATTCKKGALIPQDGGTCIIVVEARDDAYGKMSFTIDNDSAFHKPVTATITAEAPKIAFDTSGIDYDPTIPQWSLTMSQANQIGIVVPEDGFGLDNFSPAINLTGVSTDNLTTTCDDAFVKPGTTCTLNIDTSGIDVKKGEKGILELSASNYSKSIVTIVGHNSLQVVKASEPHAEYSKLVFENFTAQPASLEEVTIPAGARVVMCPAAAGKGASDDCDFHSTCTVGGQVAAAGSCDIWLKATDPTDGEFGPADSKIDVLVKGISGEKTVSFDATSSYYLFAGGEFNNEPHVAYWDGKAWNPIDLGTDGTVNAIAEGPQGNIIIGGQFTVAGETLAKDDLALWNGEHLLGIDLGGVVNGAVEALLTHGNKLYVAGQFTAPDRLAFAYDGTTYLPLGGGIQDGTIADALAIDDNKLVVGGDFNTVNSESKFHDIGEFDTATGEWTPVGNGFNQRQIFDLLVDGTNIFATGSFTAVNGTNLPVGYIARWDGSKWNALATPGLDNIGVAMIKSGAAILLGGAFQHIGGQLSPNAGQYAGSAFVPFSQYPMSEPAGKGYVRAIAATSAGNKFIFGGDFTKVGPTNGFAANHVVGWTNGAFYQSYGAGFNGNVKALLAASVLSIKPAVTE